MVQEYANYFGMNTGIFRLGCITGKQHTGAELHGFLAYMARCKREGIKYKVYGYKGKQVRDNIHAHDLVTAFDAFIENPKPGQVYNMGGGQERSISVLEALKRFDIKDYEILDDARIGDHQWYISDVSKFREHYPDWDYAYDLERIFKEMTEDE